MLSNPVTQILRWCGAFLGNAVAAVIGVGILRVLVFSYSVKLFTHSRTSIIVTEWIGSIVFAALLGVSVQRRWNTRTARWIWIPFFLVFLLALAGGLGWPVGNPWLTFSGLTCMQGRSIFCVQFTILTVPLVRTSTYSLAAFLSARFGTSQSTEFHPLLSRLLSGLFLIGLPKIDPEQSVKKPTVTNPGRLSE